MPCGKLYVGTSGWTYADWSPAFYPRGISGAKRLAYYAQHFGAVEINATFYRFPTSVMTQAWSGTLPQDFCVVMKGSRRISHAARRAPVDAKKIAAFAARARQVPQLQVLLWQFPPHLPRDLQRLDALLDALPGDVRHACEFRHASWWCSEVEARLRRHDVAQVSVSHPTLPSQVMRTASFVYARFHGRRLPLYHDDYPPQALAAWARRLRQAAAGADIYAFFNNDVGAFAVANARSLRRLLGGAGEHQEHRGHQKQRQQGR